MVAALGVRLLHLARADQCAEINEVCDTADVCCDPRAQCIGGFCAQVIQHPTPALARMLTCYNYMPSCANGGYYPGLGAWTDGDSGADAA
jgi:hypothetical protein